MASVETCRYCGASLTAADIRCPHCGAPNPGYVSRGPGAPLRPRTMEELTAYCAARKLPLDRLRFFIGEDYREPRAFGIYREGTDFVVYKNKADGSRFVRYRGPDEEKAVGELFEKLLDSCRRANIR